MHAHKFHSYDLEYMQEVRDELKNLFSLSNADAERLVQESNLPRLLAEDPVQVHHDHPEFWVKVIARQRKLQTAKPL